VTRWDTGSDASDASATAPAADLRSRTSASNSSFNAPWKEAWNASIAEGEPEPGGTGCEGDGMAPRQCLRGESTRPQILSRAKLLLDLFFLVFWLRFGTSEMKLRSKPQQPRMPPSAMAPKPKPSPDNPARGRIATAADQPDAQASVSNSAFVRAPSYSPADLAGFRDFALVMRDAIGEKGSFTELKPTQAATRGCLGTLKSLHRRGPVKFNEELCMAAAYGGLLKVLQWLLENGCPLDETALHGVTPLYMAAQQNYKAVARALIKAGADLNKASIDGWTPLCIAAYCGHETVLRALIEAGADVNKAMNGGETPLYMAAQFGHEVEVRALIKAGADISKVKYNGTTPLFMAAQRNHKAVVRALIKAGADINKASKDGGLTPLWIAAQSGHEELVRALIKATAEINAATDRGATPLFVAAQNGHQVVVRALIEAGTDVSKAAVNGATPLSVAIIPPVLRIARGNHAAVVTLLVGAGVA